MSGALAAAAGVLVVALTVWLQRRVPFLQYLNLARFPLLLALALLLLPPLAMCWLPSLLANLFDPGPHGIVIVAWVAPLAAWVVMVTLAIVVRYAPGRFGLPALAVPDWLRRHRIALFALLALPLIATCVRNSGATPAIRLVNAALGLGLALASLLAATAAQAQLRDPEAPEPETLLPTEWRIFAPLLPRTGRVRSGWLDRAAARVVLHGRPAVEGGAAQLSHGRGYVDPVSRRLRLGHLLAISFLAVTALVYAGAFVLYWRYGIAMPALGYVLLVLIMAGWALPGISFFLDRYRVPTLTLLVAISLVSSFAFNTDHYYPLLPLAAGAVPAAAAPAAPPPKLAPARAFGAAESRARASERPIVVVAASGGGVTASLWTARVLAGLQRGIGPDFTRSIRLISAVSGGSVGTMYFLDRFGRQGFPPDDQLLTIVRAAGGSSLDEIAWGAAYPDLWRAFFGYLPWSRMLDRGWAFEEALARRLSQPERTLGQWRSANAEGWMPAAVLNATVVEDGRQFLFTGLDLPPRDAALLFFPTYPGSDLRVVTAARLSATFPWVTPISRPLRRGGPPAMPGLHLADGGYYDNSGVVTVVNWLRSLLPGYRDELRRRGVLLVLIRAFPPPTASQALEPGQHRGWLYGVAGPILTLLNVHGAAQSFHNELELALLEDLWKVEGIRVRRAPFDLSDPSPLSWRLTAAERRRIVAGWNAPANRRSLDLVRSLFAPPAARGEGR